MTAVQCARKEWQGDFLRGLLKQIRQRLVFYVILAGQCDAAPDALVPWNCKDRTSVIPDGATSFADAIEESETL